MGSNFKRGVLEEHTAHALRKWHQEARKKRKKQELISGGGGGGGGTTTTSATTPDVSSHVRSPTLSNYVGISEFQITKEEHPHDTIDILLPN